jgi:hypothetical protein
MAKHAANATKAVALAKQARLPLTDAISTVKEFPARGPLPPSPAPFHLGVDPRKSDRGQ